MKNEFKKGDLVSVDKTGERLKVCDIISLTKVAVKDKGGKKRTLSTNQLSLVEGNKTLEIESDGDIYYIEKGFSQVIVFDGQGNEIDQIRIDDAPDEVYKAWKKINKGVKIKEGSKEEYQKFFNGALKKFGVKSPAELKGDKEKEFYDYVDKNWKSDDEEAGIEEDCNASDEDSLEEGWTVLYKKNGKVIEKRFKSAKGAKAAAEKLGGIYHDDAYLHDNRDEIIKKILDESFEAKLDARKKAFKEKMKKLGYAKVKDETEESMTTSAVANPTLPLSKKKDVPTYKDLFSEVKQGELKLSVLKRLQEGEIVTGYNQEGKLVEAKMIEESVSFEELVNEEVEAEHVTEAKRELTLDEKRLHKIVSLVTGEEDQSIIESLITEGSIELNSTPSLILKQYKKLTK